MTRPSLGKDRPAAAAPAPLRLAVLICGLQDRLLITNKLLQVVRYNVHQGHEVDVFVQLVQSGAQNGVVWDAVMRSAKHNRGVEDANSSTLPSIDLGGPGPRYQERLQEAVQAAGGVLADFQLLPDREDVKGELPTDAPDQVRPGMGANATYNFTQRLSQYSPLESQVGRNVLRRYKSVERIMGVVVERERARGQQYDMVLWTRDDDYWIGPLDLASLAAEQGLSDKVFSKSCLMYGGINDKTLLFGREAAQRLLPRLYSDFWRPDSRLDVENAERYMKALIDVAGATSSPVQWKHLPTAVSAYQLQEGAKVPEVCQKRLYVCCIDGQLCKHKGGCRPCSDTLPTAPPFEPLRLCAKRSRRSA